MEDEFLLRWGDLDVEILDRTNGVLQVRVPTNATTGPLTWVDASGVTSLAGRRVVAAPSTIEVLSTANGGNGISLRDGAVAKTDSGNHLVRNGTGLRLRGTATTHCRVAGNSIVQNAIGLSLEDSSQRHRIGGENTFGDNAVGIRVDHSSNHRIDRNVVRDNANQGILLTGGATNVLVIDYVPGNIIDVLCPTRLCGRQSRTPVFPRERGNTGAHNLCGLPVANSFRLCRKGDCHDRSLLP